MKKKYSLPYMLLHKSLICANAETPYSELLQRYHVALLKYDRSA